MEAWSRILDYGDRYEVSDEGNVRNRLTGRAMSRNDNGRGYQTVALSVAGQMRRRTIHSLVAQHFIGPRPKGLEVNHKDGDKTNNRVGNLEYATRSQNMKHAFESGLAKPAASYGPYVMTPRRIETAKGFRKLDDEEIAAVKAYLAQGVPQRAIARHFGISQMSIWKISKGRLYVN